MRKFLVVAVATLAMVGCCKKASVVGTWSAESDCQNKKGMMTLNADGTAKSCCKACCQLESWKQEGELLILTGTRMPKMCPSQACQGEAANCEKTSTDTLNIAAPEMMPMPEAFCDTLTIKELSAEKLVLATPCGKEKTYVRVNEEDCKKCCKEEKACCKEKCDKEGECKGECKCCKESECKGECKGECKCCKEGCKEKCCKEGEKSCPESACAGDKPCDKSCDKK